MTQTITIAMSRHIERSLLVVDPESPLDTLPFISDALSCIGTFLQHEPALNNTAGAEVGAGIMLDFLAYAVKDVQEVLEEQHRNTKIKQSQTRD